MAVILVDTSCWLHQMRPSGNPEVRSRVEQLLRAGQAAWCGPIRLELWSGVRRDGDREKLRIYEAMLPDLEITPAVWNEACALAGRCRKAGKTAPANDFLIAACARHHGVDLERADGHFEFLLAL